MASNSHCRCECPRSPPPLPPAPPFHPIHPTPTHPPHPPHPNFEPRHIQPEHHAMLVSSIDGSLIGRDARLKTLCAHSRALNDSSWKRAGTSFARHGGRQMHMWLCGRAYQRARACREPNIRRPAYPQASITSEKKSTPTAKSSSKLLTGQICIMCCASYELAHMCVSDCSCVVEWERLSDSLLCVIHGVMNSKAASVYLTHRQGYVSSRTLRKLEWDTSHPDVGDAIPSLEQLQNVIPKSHFCTSRGDLSGS